MKGKVVATSQVSRFHSETLETLSSDVHLKDVHLAVGDRTLLAGAELRLFHGIHYGLIGQNGVGKSTLLRAIGNKTLIGVPFNLMVLYVDQLEETTTGEKTVLEIVLDADQRSVRRREEARLLQSALENKQGRELAEVVRGIRMRELEDDLEAASKLATRRSGARGMAARQSLRKAEQAMANASAFEVTAEAAETASAEAQQMLAERLADFELYDEGAMEGKARRILTGLGFPREWQDCSLSKLSGGWRIRVALASALHIEPDVLLLDEPTNHLDLPAILWLQTYIQNLEGVTVVTVSHDRAFLNAVCEEMIVFRKQSLSYHVGNLDEYLQHTEEKHIHTARMADAIDKKKAAAEKSIRVGMSQARKARDDKKMAAMASKQRKLDRLGVEVNEKGHRFKLNRDRPGYHSTTRSDVELDQPDQMPQWVIPEPAALRHHGSLLQLEKVAIGYIKEQLVLNEVTLNVEQHARIGIIGPNGSGKSTLVKLLIGELAPVKGDVQRHPAAKVGYFTQHHIEDLRAQHADMSPLQLLISKQEGVREQDIRAHLSGYGVKGPLGTAPLTGLSGGQLVRVAFALSTMGIPPHLLVLDEPTNHLDFLTTEALLQALKNFGGAVIVVSHDQYFISSVAEQVYLVQRGRVRLLEKGVGEYVTKLNKRAK